MGMEEEAAQREQDFAGYQINEALVARANEGALVMHCLPAYRGKEIDEPTLEAHADTIFTQAENRLARPEGDFKLVGELGIHLDPAKAPVPS